jgi:acyl carrier protein
MDKKSILADHIRNKVMHNRGAELDENEDLVGAGILDSLRILELVAFIDKTFGIVIPDEDIVYDNFHSIKALVDYLEGYP